MVNFTENDGKLVLSPYHDALYACLMEAWEKWLTLAQMFPDPLARTRANAVYQFMLDRATERFQKMRSVHRVESRSRILFNIKDEVVVGFKKLSHKLRTRNYPTLFSLMYDAQMDLEGIPSRLPRVTVGYQLKNFNTEIDPFVVYAVENKMRWCYPLEPSTRANVVPFLPASPVSPTDEPQVRIRPADREEAEKKKQAAKIKK